MTLLLLLTGVSTAPVASVKGYSTASDAAARASTASNAAANASTASNA